MTLHPCADHPCDHCHPCDNLGICCASASAPTASLAMTTKPDTGSLTDLRTALAEDAGSGRPNRSDLRYLATITAIVPPERTPTSAASLAALHDPDDRLALPSGSGYPVPQFVRKACDVRHLDAARRRTEYGQ